MAQKRMFDRCIIETDRFLNISLSAKALYFLLGMEADDEGFVSPIRVMRLYGSELGDLKNLIDTQLVIPFKSGVVVITDWKQNNWLDARRIKQTQYQEEKRQLSLSSNNKYVLSDCLAGAEPEEYRGEERSIEENIAKKISNKNVAGIQKIIDSFKEVNPSYAILFRNKTERSAVERLIKLYGEDQLLVMISHLPVINAIPYMPITTKPTELERNAGKIKAKLEQLKTKKSENKNKAVVI